MKLEFFFSFLDLNFRSSSKQKHILEMLSDIAMHAFFIIINEY